MKLIRDRWILGVVLLILAFTAFEGIVGARFFHGELLNQIEDNLKSQALQILDGYETVDQNREIQLAARQGEILDANRVHGEFLIHVMEQAYQEVLRGSQSTEDAQRWVTDVLRRSEASNQLEGVLLTDVSSRRNALDTLLRETAKRWGTVTGYSAGSASDLLQTGALNLVTTNGGSGSAQVFVRVVYHPKLDAAVVFANLQPPQTVDVSLLLERVQGNLEQSLGLAVPRNDVIILQATGYSLYSGRFDPVPDRSVNRIQYEDPALPDSLYARLQAGEGEYRTLSVRLPDGSVQERHAYVQYDNRHRMYIVVSRQTAEMQAQEWKLIVISRLAAAFNILLTGTIAILILRRVAPDEDAPAIGKDWRLLTLSFILLALFFLMLMHSLFRLQLYKLAVNGELLEKLQVETVQMASDYRSIQQEADQNRRAILSGDEGLSRLSAEQVAGLIQTLLARSGPATDRMALLHEIQTYDDGPDHRFWIFDREGNLLVCPRGLENSEDTRTAAALWSGAGGEGTVALPDKAQGYGYRKRIGNDDWMLVAFQAQDVLARRLEGVETLRRQRTEDLLIHKGLDGSAGIVDGQRRFVEYSYVQMKGRSVDTVQLEGALPASQLLSTGENKFSEYVIVDPFDGRGRFRQAYIYFDHDSGWSYFISQDKRRLFSGIDRRSSPYLGAVALATLGMLVVCSGIVVARTVRGKRDTEGEA